MTARRDSFNEPAHGSVGGKVLLFAAAALAIAATGVLVLSDDLKYLRLGIVAGLWAALTGAFIAARYRRQVAERAEDAAERQERYELELEREIAARREHELEVEAEARRWAEQKANDDLTDLRAELQGLRQTLSTLLGGEFLVERYALHAEASRMRPLPDGDPHNEPKRLPPAQRVDKPEGSAVPPAERDADTDLIDRVRGSNEALPRRAERSPAQAQERLDRFRSVPKPHPTEVSDRWFMPDGLGESEQESDWSPSWQSNRGSASPPRGARPRAASGGTNGRAAPNGSRPAANGHAAAAGYDPRSASPPAANHPDTIGQRAAASAKRMQPVQPPPEARPNSTQSAGGVPQPAGPAAASSSRMPPANPAAASAGRAAPTGSAAQPSGRVVPTGQPNSSPSQAYPAAAASSSQMYPASASSSQRYPASQASSSQMYPASPAYSAGQPNQAYPASASSSQMYPASQASSSRMPPASAPSAAWPRQGSQADPAGRPNHALASSTQLPPASRNPSPPPSQSPAAESYGRIPSVSPVQASATRLPAPGNPPGNPAGTSGQMPPASPHGRIQPTGYVGSGRAPLGPGVPPPMAGANPPPAANTGHNGHNAGHNGYGPGYADPSAAVASGYHGFGPGYGDPAGAAASSGYHDFGPGSGGQGSQASGYVPPAESGPGAGGPVNRRSAESGYVAPVARPNGYPGGADGRHSGSHALPDADVPSGSHATGRSVSELLASNGGTAGPRRRRRRED